MMESIGVIKKLKVNGENRFFCKIINDFLIHSLVNFEFRFVFEGEFYWARYLS